MIGDLSKYSDTFSTSNVPGTKVSYSQNLRPNGINQISAGQYNQPLSTSSVLSITNASASRMTAAPYSYTSLPSTTTIAPILETVVSSAENTITNPYQTDIASIQVRLINSQTYLTMKSKNHFLRFQIFSFQ